MSRFPIVTRELRVRARLPATHRLRVLAAGAALLMSMALLPATSRGATGGQWVFHWLAGWAMVFCLLEGARVTADCVSREKRAGTLGLLFLTDLSGADVVLGKLVAVSLNSFYGLFAIVPVLALPLLVGGVTFGECARVVLVLLNTLFFSLCLGLWVSARRREHARCVMETLGLLAAFAVVPLLMDLPFTLTGSLGAHSAVFSFLSPVMSCLAALDTSLRVRGETYWSCLAVQHAFGWVFLTAASLTVVRHSREAPSPSATAGRRREKSLHSQAVGEQPPIYWLVLRRTPRLRWAWIIAAIGLVTSIVQLVAYRAGFLPGVNIPSQVIHGLVYFAFKLGNVAIACRCLNQARASGAMELLLTTPLSVSEFLRTHARAVWRALRVLLCAQILLYLSTYLTWFFMYVRATTMVVFPSSIFVSALSQLGIIIADCWATIWVGTWLALRAKSSTEAVVKTLLYVYVLPWLATTALSWVALVAMRFSYLWLHLGLILIKDALLVRWARRRLTTGFRQVAADAQAVPVPASAFRAWLAKKWTGLQWTGERDSALLPGPRV